MLDRTQLEKLYTEAVDAGETKLKYNEWVALFIMEQTKKQAAEDHKGQKDHPVNKTISSSGGKVVAKKADAPKAKPEPEKSPIKSKSSTEALDEEDSLPDTIEGLEALLTDKQILFGKEYVIDFNGARSARAAGYSKKNARGSAIDNLAKPIIRKYIHLLTQPRHQKLDITADRIMQEYATMAFSNLGDFMRIDSDGLPYVDLNDLPHEKLAALQGVDVVQMPSDEDGGPSPMRAKIKLYDKKAALDVLAKREGLLKEHIEHSGELKVVVDDSELARRVAFMLRKEEQRGKNKE